MDLVFASNNPLEIPVLDLSLQAISLDPPLVGWGTQSRAAAMRGTWHFFVDDYRFTSIWERPELVVDTGALAAIEPNLSVFDQTPYAVAVMHTYKKRWLARYWQSRGLRIWVDLNVAKAHAELNLVGVPRGWKAFATRGYEERIGDLKREFKLAEKHAGGDPTFLIYGGGTEVRAFAESEGCLHLTDDRSVARDRHRRVMKRGPKKAVRKVETKRARAGKR